MKRIAVFSAFLVSLFPNIGAADQPWFLEEESFSCADISEAVNHYVSLGEEKAVKKMTAAIDRANQHDVIGHRVCFLCRVLFEPKGKTPVRRPSFGALCYPLDQLPSESWPIYPMAKSGSTLFLLGEGYEVAGLPESPIAYIAHCRENGVFLKKPLPLPSKKEAVADSMNLRKSEAWKKIRWSEHTEKEHFGYLQTQAERVKEK